MDLETRFIDGGQSAVAATVTVGSVWVLFAGRSDVTLQPGIYLDAVRYSQQSATKPGLTLSGFARGCAEELGWFVVHEIEIDGGSGVITKLAMDFERRCTSGPDSPARAFGQLRVNSIVPRTRAAPLAIAGNDIRAFELEEVTLDGSRSEPGAHPIDGWRWTQVAGPAVTFDSTTLSVARFSTPAIPSGSVEFEFELQVTDTAGQVDTDRVRVTAMSPAAPRNLLRIDGRLGDHIGQGVYETFEEEDGLFVIDLQDENAFALDFQGGPGASYGLTLRAPEGQALVAGNYEDADRGTGDSPLRPQVDAASFGHACNSSAGRFVVHEIVRDPGSGNVERLAVDFMHYCDAPFSGDPPLFGGAALPVVGAARTCSEPTASRRRRPDRARARNGRARRPQYDARIRAHRSVALAPGLGNCRHDRGPEREHHGHSRRRPSPRRAKTLRFELRGGQRRWTRGHGRDCKCTCSTSARREASPPWSAMAVTVSGRYAARRPSGCCSHRTACSRSANPTSGGPSRTSSGAVSATTGVFNVFTDRPLAVGEYEVDSELALYPTIQVVANSTRCGIMSAAHTGYETSSSAAIASSALPSTSKSTANS